MGSKRWLIARIAPESCPHAPEWVVERLLELGRRRRWGAKKLRRLLADEHGWTPSIDTIHRLLVRHGLVQKGNRAGVAPILESRRSKQLDPTRSGLLTARVSSVWGTGRCAIP